MSLKRKDEQPEDKRQINDADLQWLRWYQDSHADDNDSNERILRTRKGKR